MFLLNIIITVSSFSIFIYTYFALIYQGNIVEK